MIAVTIAASVAGCGRPVDASCLTPRPDEETLCDVVDAGTEWRFVDGEPLPDIEPFCSSKCVDFPGTLTLIGQRDLRKVPLLPKLRKVDRLVINVAGLPDLRGLERVDIGSLLDIVNYRPGSPDPTFVSTAGLEDAEIDVVGISNTPGLTNLGTVLRRVTSFSVVDTGIREIDISNISVGHLELTGNDELRSVELGSGAMESLWIDTNSSLDTLSWGVRSVKSIRISRNPRLSTCRVQEFVQDAGAVPALVTVLDNGPCP